MSTTPISLITDAVTDGSHPRSGNLALLNGGRAYFGGVLYERVLPAEPPQPTPTLADFKPGDRVVVTGEPWPEVLVGSLGVVKSVTGYVNIDLDGHGPNDTYPYDPDEIAHSDEPIPRVYEYPEGLYKATTGDRVFIQHEDSEGGYLITYLDAHAGSAFTPVNHGMTAVIVSSYELVAPA